jgi:hypothetical protein
MADLKVYGTMNNSILRNDEDQQLAWMPQGPLIPHSQQWLSFLMELIHHHNWDLENTRQWPQASKEKMNTVPDSVISSLYKAYIISIAHCHNKEVYSHVKIQHIS